MENEKIMQVLKDGGRYLANNLTDENPFVVIVFAKDDPEPYFVTTLPGGNEEAIARLAHLVLTFKRADVLHEEDIVHNKP